MTSFAAQGWVEEDGTWYYYDKDGNKVENEWKKSGDNWFYLDGEEGGAMATDKIVVDDKDNTYYVDGNGVMVTNTWVKVVNEDQDDDDDPLSIVTTTCSPVVKLIKLAITAMYSSRLSMARDMLSMRMVRCCTAGLRNLEPNLATDDEDWKDCLYYLGSWEDGSMKTGWQRITAWDDEKKMIRTTGSTSSPTVRNVTTAPSSNDKSVLTKKINGKTYGFDDRGVMVYE